MLRVMRTWLLADLTISRAGPNFLNLSQRMALEMGFSTLLVQGLGNVGFRALDRCTRRLSKRRHPFSITAESLAESLVLRIFPKPR